LREKTQGIGQKVITTYIKPAPPTGIYKYLNGSNILQTFSENNLITP